MWRQRQPFERSYACTYIFASLAQQHPISVIIMMYSHRSGFSNGSHTDSRALEERCVSTAILVTNIARATTQQTVKFKQKCSRAHIHHLTAIAAAAADTAMCKYMSVRVEHQSVAAEDQETINSANSNNSLRLNNSQQRTCLAKR
eukprot:17688-Heterococcus_DN1.PRE.1